MWNRSLRILAVFAVCGVGTWLLGYYNGLMLADVSNPICDDLFRHEGGADSSLYAPHTPPEAQGALLPRTDPTPEPGQRVPTELVCTEGLPVLASQTIVEGPGVGATHFSLAPSGQRMALYVAEGNDAEGNYQAHVELVELESGTTRRLTDEDHFVLSWLDDRRLFMLPDGERPPYLRDVESGRTTPFEVRWEFNELDEARFVGDLYTGWQASDALEVEPRQLCAASRQGLFHPVAAGDGTLLLTRDELLARGAEVLRSAHEGLLTRDGIDALLAQAGTVYLLRTDWRAAPLRGWEWPYTLVLTDLPRAPHNLLIRVSSPRFWEERELLSNQVGIAGHFQHGVAAHPLFFVAPNPCPGSEEAGYRYVLYRKHNPGGAPSPVGILPYPEATNTEMVWSPDQRYIYIQQHAFGRHSVSRVPLPTDISAP